MITNEFRSHIIQFRNTKHTKEKKDLLRGKKNFWKIEIALKDGYSMMCVFEREKASKQTHKRFDEIKRVCQRCILR